jgi:hypothetical protein
MEHMSENQQAKPIDRKSSKNDHQKKCEIALKNVFADSDTAKRLVAILKKCPTTYRVKIFNELESSNDASDAEYFAAFANHVDPTQGRKGRVTGKFLNWICEQYIREAEAGNQIKSEDLYKIRKDLEDFDNWSKRLRENNMPYDIDDISTYEELKDILRPFQQNRDKKRAARALYRNRFNSESKTNIDKSTTIIYDGPLGKVVVPHSKESAQFWGMQTRWCISATEAENQFDDINFLSPVVMYIPKLDPKVAGKNNEKYTSFKMAAALRKLWDELDDYKLQTIPSIVQNLAIACRTHLESCYGPSSTALEWIDFYGLNKSLIEMGNSESEKPSIRGDINSYPQEWQQELKINRESTYGAVSPNRWDDEHFMKAAIEQNPYALQFASTRLKDRKEIVSLAISQNGDVLKYASKRLQDDYDIVMEAVQNNLYALQYASTRLQDDYDIVMKAVQKHGYALKYCSKALKNNHKIIVTALRSYPYSYELLPNDQKKNPKYAMLALVYGDKYLSGLVPRKVKRQIQNIKTDPRYALHAAQLIPFEKDMDRATSEAMIKLLSEGEGLSSALIPKSLLSNEDYVIRALKAVEGNSEAEEATLENLRHCVFFQGSFESIISMRAAKASINYEKELNIIEETRKAIGESPLLQKWHRIMCQALAA